MSKSKYVVMVGAFVRNLDKAGKRVERAARGAVIELDSEVHDIEHLVKAGIVATEADVKSGKAKPLTARQLSQRAAKLADQDSPVLSLSVQPEPITAEGVEDTGSSTPASGQQMPAPDSNPDDQPPAPAGDQQQQQQSGK